MTRKAAWAGMSFWAALLLAAAFRSEMNTTFLLTACGLAVVCFAAFKELRHHIAVCLIFFVLGISVNSCYTHFVYDKLTELDGQTVTISGYIKDRSQISGRLDRIVVCGKVNGIRTEISFVLPYDDLRYYDEISVTDTVSIIEDGVKFESGSYNYSRSVFLQGGYDTCSYKLTGKSVNPLFREIKEYRDKLFLLIMDTCPQREGAFLGAMLCGDKSEMTPAMKTELYRSGLGHIFAVSGIHLVIAVTFFGAVLERLIKSRHAVYILTIVEIWSFAVFAGMSVSVVRAAVMLTITRSGFLFGRKSDGLNSLGLCAILLTAAKPYTAISPSFVLSFLAVFAIEMVSLYNRENEESKPENSFRLSSAVLFTTAPASAGMFGGVSVMTIITNILLVPVCTLSLQLCFVVLLTGGVRVIAKPLLRIAALPVRFVLYCSDELSMLDVCYVFTGSKMVFAVVCVTSLAMTVFLFRVKEFRKVALMTVTVLAVWCAAANIRLAVDDDISVTVLPGGRKTAYVVTDKGKAFIFDVGCKGRLDGAIQHQLDRLGVNSMPYVFISEQGALTSSFYYDDFFLSPDLFFIDDDPLIGDNEKLKVLAEGDTADIGDMTVTPAGSGYNVEIDGNSITFGKGKLVINGDEVDITKESTVLVLEGTTLRRL